MKTTTGESMMSIIMSDLKRCNELVIEIKDFRNDLKNIQTFVEKWDVFNKNYKIRSESMRLLRYNFDGFKRNIIECEEKISEAWTHIQEINTKSLQRMDNDELLAVKKELKSRIKYLESIKKDCFSFMDYEDRKNIIFKLISGYLYLCIESRDKKSGEELNLFTYPYCDEERLDFINLLKRINGLLTNPDHQRDFSIMASRDEYRVLLNKGDIANIKTADDYLNAEEDIMQILKSIIDGYKNNSSHEKNKLSTFFELITNTQKKESINIMINIKRLISIFQSEDNKTIKGLLDRCILENYNIEEELGRFGIIYLEENLWDLVNKRDELIISILKEIDQYFTQNIEIDETKIDELLTLQNMIITILRRLYLGREEYVQMLLRNESTPLSLKMKELLKDLGIDEVNATKENIQAYFDNLVTKYVDEEIDKINKKNEEKTKNQKKAKVS